LGPIEFLGQIFTPEPLSLANEVMERLINLAKGLFYVNIPKHQQLMIYRQCIVTATNWAPLLDISNGKEEYKKVDTKLTEILE